MNCALMHNEEVVLHNIRSEHIYWLGNQQPITPQRGNAPLITITNKRCFL